jgi:hypothetical protein
MKTVSFGNMTDYDAEAQQLAERKRYAEALRQQGQQAMPAGQMVGNQFVATHPLQHLANALRQYSGQRELQDVRTAEQGLAQRKQSDLADYLKSMPSATTTTEQQLVGDRPGAGSFEPVSTTKQPTPEDFMNWSMQGLKFGPQVAQLGGNMANQVQQRDFQNRQLEQQTADRQAAIKQAEMQFQTKLQEGRLTREQAAQQAMQLEQMRLDGRREIAQLTASLKQGGAGAQPYYQPVQTAQGVMAFNARTGKMEPVQVNGQAIVGAQADPTLQGNIAGAKATGTERAKNLVEAQAEAPKVVQQAEYTEKLVNDLLAHPGKKMAVGMSSINPMNYIPGTEGKDFRVRLEQLQGQQFMQAFESLKGGGQITNVEGDKATRAISRMQTAQSEPEFDEAAKEFLGVVKLGAERAKKKAGPVAAPAGPSIDDILNKY